MDISTIALQGLQQADIQLNQAASRIASLGAFPSNGTNLDTVSLSIQMVALMSARNLADVSLQTLQAAGEMQKTTIDLMA